MGKFRSHEQQPVIKAADVRVSRQLLRPGFGEMQGAEQAPAGTHFDLSHVPVLPGGSMSLPVQAKLTVGAPNDKYEQEADAVAAKVVQQINAPAPVQSVEPGVQRETMPEEEELQMKPMLQREEAEEDELQMKPMLQREEMPEEEELQMKPMVPSLQREEMAEEDELQMKPMLQRRGDGSGETSAVLESELNGAMGGGQALPEGLQRSMGKAMGADFSGVRVHTDARSDQLNRSVQAKAFTTGKDVFFRQGEYQPGSRGGQELLAHELTHVVQQGNRSAKGKVASTQETLTANHIQCYRGGGRTRRKHYRILGDLAAFMAFGPKQKRLATPKNRYTSLKKQSQTVAAIGKGQLYGTRYERQNGAAPGAKVVLLLSGSHGNNSDQMLGVAEVYCSTGSVAYGFDYRGFGQSTRTGVSRDPSEKGMYRDSLAMLAHVRAQEGCSNSDIVVHGFSLGGAVASWLALREANAGQGLGGLVLHSSIDSMKRAANRGSLGIGGAGARAALGGFNTRKHLRQLAQAQPNIPLHLISGYDGPVAKNDYSKGEGDDLSLMTTGLHLIGSGSFTDKTDQMDGYSHMYPTLGPKKVRSDPAVMGPQGGVTRNRLAAMTGGFISAHPPFRPAPMPPGFRPSALNHPLPPAANTVRPPILHPRPPAPNTIAAPPRPLPPLPEESSASSNMEVDHYLAEENSASSNMGVDHLMKVLDQDLANQ